MKKKLLIALLAITFVFGCTFGFTACGEKEFEKVSGSEGLEYTLSDDGTYYYLSGLGTCTDTEVTVANYYNDKPVTSIGVLALYGCANLTSIKIPHGVTNIEEGAFAYCAVTNVTLPDSATIIGDHVFEGCGYLTNISLPDGVISIGDCAFYRCINLTSINIPDSVTSVGKNAFFECGNLTEVTIGKGITKICYGAFSGSCPHVISAGGDITITITPFWHGLTSIYFNGTKEQWNAIEKEDGWDAYTKDYTIHCTDGDIAKE